MWLECYGFWMPGEAENKMREIHILNSRDESAQNMALGRVRFGFEERGRRKDHSVS
jgi:hypothetical protein